MNPSDLGLSPHQFPSYLPGQEDVITRIVSSPTPRTLLQAPTGVGKTVVGVSSAKAQSSRFLYLTATKSLQRQLESSFSSDDFFNISGHSSYPCATNDDETGFFCDSARFCEYRSDVATLQSMSFISTNYHHWIQLSLSGVPDRLGEFDFIVMDEAHKIPEIIRSICAIKIKTSHYRKHLLDDLPHPKHSHVVLDNKDFDLWRQWAESAKKSLSKLLSSSRKEKDEKRSQILSNLIYTLDRLINETDPQSWVGQVTTDGVSFTPLDASQFASQHLFRDIPKILFCSATVTPEDIKELGVSPSDLTSISVPSPFDLSRRPVYYYPTSPSIKFDHRSNEGETRLIVNQVDRIIESRLDYKGIIPVRSYQKGLDLISRSKYSSLMLFHKDRHSFRETITRFKRSKYPCILVSPTIDEGIDFPGDLCRYIIMMKVPFYDSRDPIISRLKKLDPTYTDRQTARTIIQTAGRGMRSQSDYCETFIIDGHWGYFKEKPYFPKYFSDAFQTIRSIPPPLEFSFS